MAILGVYRSGLDGSSLMLDKGVNSITLRCMEASRASVEKIVSPSQVTYALLDPVTNTYSIKVATRLSKRYAQPLSGPALQSWLYFATDPSSLVRNMNEVIPHMSPTSNAILGLTSSASMFTGAVTTGMAVTSTSKAFQNGDEIGQVSGGITVLRGVFEALSGMVVTAYRVLCLVPKIPGAITGVVGAASSSGFSGVYALMGLSFSILAHGVRVFSGEFAEARSAGKGYEFLKEALSLSKEDIEAALSFIPEYGTEPKRFLNETDEISIAYGYEQMKNGLLESDESIDPSLKKSLGRLELLLPEGFDTTFSARLRVSDPAISRATTAVVIDALLRTIEKKQTRVERAIGGALADEVLSSKGLTPEEKEVLVEKCSAQTRKNLGFYIFLATTCAVGTVGMLLSAVATGGILPVVAASVMLGVSVVMVGVDAYFLYDAMMTMKAEKWEKTAMRVLAVAITILSVAATAVSGGVVPAVVLSGVGLFWLLFFIASARKWKETEEREPLIERQVVGTAI